MKKRNYFLLTAVAFVAVLNLFLSINGQSLSSGLKLLTVEAIANAEYNPTAPLDKRYVPHGCGIETKVIVGEYPDGRPIIQTIYERGQSATCESGFSSCTPYECTKILKP